MKRLLLLLCLTAGQLLAQDFVIPLDNWRVTTGDDPRWAQLDYDDSAWLPSAPPRRRNSLQPFYAGFRWYRAQTSIPPNMQGQKLAFGIGPLDEVFDVFVNGIRIATFGQWMPRVGYFPQNLAISIPPAALRGSVVHVAVRRWTGASRTNYSPLTLAGAVWFSKVPEIGLAPLVSTRQELQRESNRNSASINVLANVGLVAAGLLSLALFFAQGASRDMLWFALAFLSAGVAPLACFGAELAGLPLRTPLAALAVGLQMGSATFLALFLADICPKLKWPLYLTAAAEGVIAVWTAWSFYTQLLSYPLYSGWTFLEMAAPVAVSITLIMDRRSAQSRLLAAALCLEPAAEFWSVQMAVWFRLPEEYRNIHAGPWVIDPRNIAWLVFAFLALSLFYARHRREQESQAAVLRDLAAARLVQESLLVGGQADTPGFQVETEYSPASEVGGDFYHQLPGADGSLLVLVGDVSGKGMRAALLVGHISGALSNERSRQPAEVLANLNESLIGRMSGGFVTCCCVLFAPDGSATVANAGHPAPYAGGRELAVEAGLPLGIVSGCRYSDHSFEVKGDQLFTMISDGVLEAANGKGELFGFDRAREISGGRAADIVDAARAWGQNDDITVVTVRRTAGAVAYA